MVSIVDTTCISRHDFLNNVGGDMILVLKNSRKRKKEYMVDATDDGQPICVFYSLLFLDLLLLTRWSC